MEMAGNCGKSGAKKSKYGCFYIICGLKGKSRYGRIIAGDENLICKTKGENHEKNQKTDRRAFVCGMPL
ncbi:MAG: hypothetical protein IJW69_02185, partial [Clostridia bacterium]|nr:hypothetical protein [Clostridia bacterium]